MNRPWMPLYVADYLADTAHLNAAQSGAYLHLIMFYWQTGGLPDEDKALSRIARMTPAEWKRTRPLVQPFFSDGWKHGRIEFELTEAARISAAGRKGGEASARSRRSRSNDQATIVQRPGDDSPTKPPALQPQSQTQEESSLRSGARKRASRLPADWVLDPEGIEFARLHGLAARESDLEAEKFRNYWTAKSGKDAAKLDWPATWRNWILNAEQRKGQPNGHGHRGAKSGSAGADFFAGIASVAADLGGNDPMAGPTDPDIPRGRVEIDG